MLHCRARIVAAASWLGGSQVLQLVQCRNVRNRDLFALAHSTIQLHSLTIGDDCNKPWVTNKGLSSIGRMASLRRLALHDCNSITNNGLTSLVGLSQLVELSLRGCRKITNHGLDLVQVGCGSRRPQHDGRRCKTSPPTTSFRPSFPSQDICMLLPSCNPCRHAPP